jgi:putative PIN family toxin of toxin-antitoxin system
VLGYEKLARRIATLHTTIRDLLAGYRSLVEIVPAATISPTVIADPDDDHVLACAIAANADFIVSGDKHLLDLKRHQGIEIVNAGEALRRITQIE